jgi:hypothetical protein
VVVTEPEWHVRDGGRDSGEYDRTWEVWEGDTRISGGHTRRVAAVTVEAHNFGCWVRGLEADVTALRAAIGDALDAIDRGDVAGAAHRLRATLATASTAPTPSSAGS